MNENNNLPAGKMNGVKIYQPGVRWKENSRHWNLLGEVDLKSSHIFGIESVTNFPGVVEGWHSLLNGALYITCVRGMIKLALFDNRRDSDTFGELQEIFLGESRPLIVKVPEDVFYGWKSLPESSATVLLLLVDASPDFDHLPEDSDRIPYRW